LVPAKYRLALALAISLKRFSMSEWTAGYVADIGYTYGYYAELNPLRTRWALLNAGLEPPAGLMAQGSTACELGFGQGLSINTHAAASRTEWWGTDFNPSQAAFAHSLASASGAAVRLFDDSFEEFAKRADLPDFDTIGVHGIWSWISDENRALIVDFVRRKLKVGGVLYISYNTQPGWSAAMPLRHLLTRYAESAGSPNQGKIGQIDAALNFTEQFFAANPKYIQAVPQAAERLKQLKAQDRSYLAHEYFNRDWHPMHFADIAAALQEAKLSFGCSAHMIDHVDAVNLTPDQRKLIDANRDQVLRETLRDFCVNQQFRRDLWVKGARPLAPLAQLEAVRKQRFVLVLPRDKVPLTATSALGEVKLKQELYSPVVEALANNQPREFAQIEKQVAEQGVNFTQLKEILTVLVGTQSVHLAQDERAVGKAKSTTDALNQHLMMLSRSTGDVHYLASPVTGGGYMVPRFQQLFLLSRLGGAKTAAEIAATTWRVLEAQGQRIIKEGKPLPTVEDNVAHLTAEAEAFLHTQLPILRALGIAA
jgi:SAM-dependent methyltransferase